MTTMSRLDALEASLVNMKREYDVLVDEVVTLMAQEKEIQSRKNNAVYRRNGLYDAMNGLITVIDDMKRKEPPNDR